MKLAFSAVLLYGELAPSFSWVPSRNPNNIVGSGGNNPNGGLSYFPRELEAADRGAAHSISSERGTIGFLKNDIGNIANEISTLPNAADTANNKSSSSNTDDGGMASYMQAFSQTTRSSGVSSSPAVERKSGTMQITESMEYHVEFMKSQLEEYSKALADARRDVDKWKALHTEAQSQVEFLERSKASLEKLVDESREEASKATRRLSKAEAEMESFHRQNLGTDARMALEEQRLQAENMSKEFEHQLDNARRQLNSMRLEHDTLVARLEDSQSRIEAAESIKTSVESRNVHLEGGLTKAHETIRALQGELEGYHKRMEEMKSQKDALLEESNRSLKTVQEENVSLVRKIEEILAAGSDSSREVTKYQQDVEMWKQRYGETEAKLQELESSKSHLESLLNEANAQNKLSISDNGIMVKRLQQEMEQLEMRLASEQDSFAEQRRQIEDQTAVLKQQLKASEAQVVELQSEKEVLSKQLDEMQSNRGNVYKEFKAAEFRIEDLESRLRTAEGKEKLMSNEQMHFQHRIRELESLLASSGEQGKEWEQELSKSRDQSTFLENMVEDLKANVEEVKLELNRSKKFGEIMKSENDAAQTELQSVQSSNADLKRLLDDAQAQTSKAQASSAQYRAELQNLQNELQATRHRLSDSQRKESSNGWGGGGSGAYPNHNPSNTAKSPAFSQASTQLFWERNREFLIKLVLPGSDGTRQPIVRRIKLPRLMDHQGKLSYDQLVLLTGEFVRNRDVDESYGNHDAVHEKFASASSWQENVPFKLHYYDCDNDTIAITCSEELLDAVDQFSHLQVLRLVVGGDKLSTESSTSLAVSSHNSHSGYQESQGNFYREAPNPVATPAVTTRPFIHGRHSCDSCGMRPIVGPRYHATNRDNLDVCQNCLSIFRDQSIQFEMARDDIDVTNQNAYHDHRQKQAEQAAAISSQRSQSMPQAQPADHLQNRRNGTPPRRFSVPCDQSGQNLI